MSVRFLFPLWSSLLFAGLFGIHCQCNAVRGKATDATLVSLAGALLLLKKQRVGGGEEGYGGTTPKFLIYIPLCPSLLPPPSRHVLTHPKPFWPLTIYLETQVNSQPQNTKVSHSVFITLKSQFWTFQMLNYNLFFKAEIQFNVLLNMSPLSFPDCFNSGWQFPFLSVYPCAQLKLVNWFWSPLISYCVIF